MATVADHILIPVQPSAPDLRAIHQTIQIAESAGTPATVVINCAIVNHPTIAQSHRILCRKGSGVCLMGDLTKTRWPGRDGAVRDSWSLVANDCLSAATTRRTDQ